MAISEIHYLPGSTFTYQQPGDKQPSTYTYSMALAVGHYATDEYGRAILPQKDADKAKLDVRSYYTVTTDEPAYTNYPLTLEGLTQLISTRRARTVEAEIQPMATTIQQRNDNLEELGTALGLISAGLAWFDDSRSATDWYVNSELQRVIDKYFTAEEAKSIYTKKQNGGYSDSTWDEKELRKANAAVKSKIDKMNNEAQTDMSRMETLVSKRDESFSLATDLTSTISDGRTSIINNMGG